MAEPATLGPLNIYLPIEKIDKQQRMIWGWASVATENGKALKDLQGEIVPLDAIKAALPGWMEWGGPIRAMHQPIAAGTTKQAQIIEGPDKDKEGLYIGAYIGDDVEWRKVCDEIYRGLSIGGEKLEKIGDTVTKLNLYEVSLVDRPANPACRIDVFKAAGMGVDSSVALVSGWSPNGDVHFDRQEVGVLGRVIAKLGFGKTDDNYARDGFSRPAVVDGGNPMNRQPAGPSEPIPHVITSPAGTPIPSQAAYLNDIPAEHRDRILLMAGKYHAFSVKGEHLGAFDDGPAAAKAFKEHLDAYKAQKMIRKAGRRARKIAKVARQPIELAKKFKRERTVLKRHRVARGHRTFLKTMIAVVQPPVAKKAQKQLTRKRLVRALERLQVDRVRKLYGKRDLEAMEKGILGTLSARGLLKKEESTASVNDLPDKEFAYIEPGGSKDDEGKTTPRSLRHLPIHDASHVRNAAARLNQTQISAGAKAKAHRKIKARGKEFGVEISDGEDSQKMARRAEKKAKKIAKQMKKNGEMGGVLDELRRLHQDILAESTQEGGDPEDDRQANHLGAVISQIENHEAQELNPDDNPFGPLDANGLAFGGSE